MQEIILPAWVEPHSQRARLLTLPKSPELEPGINLGYQQLVRALITEQNGTADWAEQHEQPWVRFSLIGAEDDSSLKKAIQVALQKFMLVEPRIGRDPSPEYTIWPKQVIRPHQASAIIEKFGLVTGEQKGSLYVARALGFPGKHPGARADTLVKNGFHRLGPNLVTQTPQFLQETRSTPRNNFTYKLLRLG